MAAAADADRSWRCRSNTDDCGRTVGRRCDVAIVGDGVACRWFVGGNVVGGIGCVRVGIVGMVVVDAGGAECADVAAGRTGTVKANR